MEREELIKKIVEEKGEEAIPVLIKLLEDEDTQVREIASQTLKAMGGKVVNEVRNYIEEKLKDESFDDVSLLYAADILGELKDKNSIPLLYELLEHYDDEAYQLVIYDALSKLGEGAKFLDLLEYLLLEDAYRESLKDQVIMILSEIEEARTVDILSKAWELYKEDHDTSSMILKAFELLFMKKPDLLRILEELNEELAKKFKF